MRCLGGRQVEGRMSVCRGVVQAIKDVLAGGSL